MTASSANLAAAAAANANATTTTREIETGGGAGIVTVAKAAPEMTKALQKMPDAQAFDDPLNVLKRAAQRRAEKEKRMPEEYRDDRGDDRDRGDRDRDRDRWPDVHPEKPSKNFYEAAEDVQGALKVSWDVTKDVFKEKATAEAALGVYDRINDAREL